MENQEIGMETKCEFCGETRGYYDFKKNIWFEIEEHRFCRSIARYEKLSIFDKEAKKNTFEISIPKSEKENLFLEDFKKYCNNFEEAKKSGVGLFFTGNAGTGKTFYSNCIANELKKNKHTVLSFNLSGYFQEIKSGFDEKAKDKEVELLSAIKDVDITIIDDVGSESVTDWAKERIFNLFNTIYINRKCLIVTTNLTGDDLKKHFAINGSDKVIDRLTELCKAYKFDWKSRRQELGKVNFEKVFK